MTKGAQWTYQNLWGLSVPEEFVNETQPVILGTRIQFHAAGRIIGARYYRNQGSIGGNIAFIKPSISADQIYATTVFHHRNAGDGPAEGEWQNAYFARPYYRVEAEDIAILCVAFRQGLYYANRSVFDGTSLIVGDLEATEDLGAAGTNGLYTYDTDWNAFHSFNSSHYGVDVLFLADHQTVG